MPSRANAIAGLAWMALSAILFALMGFFARLASAHAHWALIAAIRAAVGAVVAYTVARARVAPLFVKDRRGIWLRSGFGTVSILCTFYAVSSPAISLGDAATLSNLTPVFIALAAPIFLGERSGRRVAIALPLSVAGVVLVLHPAFVFGGGAPRTAASLFAAAVAGLASISSAAAMMMLRRISQREGAEAISLHFSLVAAATCFLVAIPHLTGPTRQDVLFMLVAGVSAGLAQIAMTRAYALEGAARVSGMAYLSVVVSASLGAAFLGEAPGPSATLGMALVIAGGLVVTIAGINNRNYRVSPKS